MIPSIPRNLAMNLTAALSSGRVGGVVFAMALSGCIPIPIQERAYVPNKADVTLSSTGRSGCALNEAAKTGIRTFGTVKVSASLRTRYEGTAQAQALLYVRLSQQSATGKFVDIALNPARIKLQEAGRSLTARQENRRTGKNGKGQTASTTYELAFAPPSGVSEDLRVVFETGAIRIGGRPVAFAPIRFSVKNSPMVYLFPCIPT